MAATATASKGQVVTSVSSPSSSSHQALPANQEIDVEEEVHEQAPIVKATDPSLPTQEEVDEHNLTHLPHRSWCPVCIKARGKESPHKATDEERKRSRPSHLILKPTGRKRMKTIR